MLGTYSQSSTASVIKARVPSAGAVVVHTMAARSLRSIPRSFGFIEYCLLRRIQLYDLLLRLPICYFLFPKCTGTLNARTQRCTVCGRHKKKSLMCEMLTYCGCHNVDFASIRRCVTDMTKQQHSEHLQWEGVVGSLLYGEAMAPVKA